MLQGIIIPHFSNTSLSKMERLSRQKINKETADFSKAIDQMYNAHIRICYQTAVEYTFFSSAHGTYSKMNHMLGHKNVLTNLRKLKS